MTSKFSVLYYHILNFTTFVRSRVREDGFKNNGCFIEVLQLSYLDQSPPSVVCHQSCVWLVSPNICFNLADLHEVTLCPLKHDPSENMAAIRPPSTSKKVKKGKKKTSKNNKQQQKTINLKTFCPKPLIRIQINSARMVTL